MVSPNEVRATDKGHPLAVDRIEQSLQFPFTSYVFPDKYVKDNVSSSSANIQNRERPSATTSSPTTVTMSNGEKYEAKKSIVILIAIFLISIIAMFYVYMMFPELEAWVFSGHFWKRKDYRFITIHNFFFPFSGPRSSTWNCRGTLKMRKIWAKCCIGTKTCTISRSCLPSSSFTYCKCRFIHSVVSCCCQTNCN